ncbi:GNAT family N-acetyltransferase [Bacillus sp. 31A1R]|uniref:GNAT family N-acetyltransferase n=1 Tax=Robertmurraya mangrovi TaxID=3098077 RepID=A0ABU5IWL2_9BACI|nr:GNAT family N-acetyltransferase [Bacillus sp. 31A1R]MDZ5471539.1 GNAT family N-acetyltransferase [Bacillus sp. 31A1R]
MYIKRLQPEDGEYYRILRLEALRNNPEAFSSSFEEEKGNSVEFYQNRLKSTLSYTFGAYKENELIGVVSLVCEDKLKIRHRANIFAMYVSEEGRGKGVGRKLMSEAINQAKCIRNIEQLYLTVVSSNEPAKNLYASLGFEIIGEDKKALKVGNTYYDEDLMVLYLT